MSEFDQKTEHKKEAGLALIWVLMVLAVTSALSLAFLQKVSIGISTAGTRSDAIQAQYLAEAAANHAMWGLLHQETFPEFSDRYYMHSLGTGRRYGYKVRRHTNTTFATVAVVGGVGDTVVHQSYVIYVKGSWYHDRAWKYRRKISILANVTDSDLTDFPYMVKLNIDDTNDDLFMNAQLDGDDILFTDSDRKTKLEHELEKYTSLDGTEELVAWVRLPLLSSSDATEIYMYYGNHAAANQENAVDVWSNNDYVSVYHLHDDFEDSVGNHDGTNTRSIDVAGPLEDALPMADAQLFCPSDDSENPECPPSADGVDFIDIGTWSVAEDKLTIQAWIRSGDELDQKEPWVIAKAFDKDRDDFVWGMGLTGKGNDTPRFYLKTGTDDGSITEELKGSSKLSKSNWHHVAMTYDGSLMRIIKDGQQDNETNSVSGNIHVNEWDIQIGNNPGQDELDEGKYSWDGNIDEVRISTVARSVDWMMAEYRNQNSQPETYLSLEVEEHRYLGTEDIEFHFESGVEDFAFSPNTFRDTLEAYASGDRVSSGGFGNDGGALKVQLGGIDDITISGMSGGWEKTFDLDADSDISISFVYKLDQTSAYESDELSQVLVKVDSTLYGEGGGWWNTDWLNRTKITFNNTASAENLDDFPVLVTLRADNVDFDKIMADGEDIRFVDDDGTLLNHEIETWDDFNEIAKVWVKVPQIDAGSNTDFIHLYYNNTGASDTQNTAGVWDANHKGVWHLAESGNGTLDEFADSTTNANHGQGGAGVAGDTPTQIAGQIGNGQDFDETTEFIAVPKVENDIDVTKGTMSAWITLDPSSSLTFAFETKGADAGNGIGLWWNDGLREFVMYYSAGGTLKTVQTGAVSEDSAWHLATITWDTGADEVKAFIDGSQVGGTQTGLGTWAGGFNGYGTIGAQSKSGRWGWWDGIIDEARISDKARSADWIKASYLSQNGTFAFCTFGGEGAGDYVAQIAGDGDGGSDISTGWKRFRVDLGRLSAGDHTLTIGGYNNKKTDDDEITTIIIDDVIIWK